MNKLDNLIDIDRIDDQLYMRKMGLTVKNKNDLFLIKYNKKFANYNSLLRSVLIKNWNIISFSPPKSIQYNIFKDTKDILKVKGYFDLIQRLFYNFQFTNWPVMKKK